MMTEVNTAMNTEWAPCGMDEEAPCGMEWNGTGKSRTSSPPGGQPAGNRVASSCEKRAVSEVYHGRVACNLKDYMEPTTYDRVRVDRRSEWHWQWGWGNS